MSTNKFDRILNIALGIAVTLFVIDYAFIRETPPSFDSTKEGAFAPVQLSKVEHTTESAAAMASNPTGGPEVAQAEPFTALNWEQLEAEVGGDVPTLMIVFTSWCPFCKKLLPEIVSLANERGEKLNVVAISFDEDPTAIRGYISSLPQLPPFTVYNHSSDNERSLVQAFLFKNKMNFTGAIPFMGIFQGGEAKQQIGGFVEKSVLTEMLGRIEQQKNVNNDLN